MTELAYDLRRLARIANPKASKETQEDIALERFKDILDIEMKKMLTTAKPKSLDEALVLAIEFEVVLDGDKQSRRLVRSVDLDSILESDEEYVTSDSKGEGNNPIPKGKYTYPNGKPKKDTNKPVHDSGSMPPRYRSNRRVSGNQWQRTNSSGRRTSPKGKGTETGNRSGQEETRTCYFCLIQGHIWWNCPKRRKAIQENQ